MPGPPSGPIRGRRIRRRGRTHPVPAGAKTGDPVPGPGPCVGIRRAELSAGSRARLLRGCFRRELRGFRFQHGRIGSPRNIGVGGFGAPFAADKRRQRQRERKFGVATVDHILRDAAGPELRGRCQQFFECCFGDGVAWRLRSAVCFVQSIAAVRRRAERQSTPALCRGELRPVRHRSRRSWGNRARDRRRELFRARLDRASAVRESEPWRRRRPNKPARCARRLAACCRSGDHGIRNQAALRVGWVDGFVAPSPGPSGRDRGVRRRRRLPLPSASLFLLLEQLFVPPLLLLPPASIACCLRISSSTKANRPEPPVARTSTAFSISGSARRMSGATMGSSNARLDCRRRGNVVARPLRSCRLWPRSFALSSPCRDGR